MSDKLIRYSEEFFSQQFEGAYIGRPTLWIRLWGCSLKCHGFSQKDPTDSSTYEFPYNNLDWNTIHKLEDLPVLDRGCDSAYSWDKRFLKLAKKGTAQQIARSMYSLLDPEAIKNSGGIIDVAFTGGEPMMQQDNILSILAELQLLDSKDGILSGEFTIETNATLKLKDSFVRALEYNRFKPIFSMSPKLFTVAGEKNAIHFDIIESYIALAKHLDSLYWLKFVVANRQECWDELEPVLQRYKFDLISQYIYIMPVGATEEQQCTIDVQEICTETLKRGLRFSPRVQNYIFGNAVGK